MRTQNLTGDQDSILTDCESFGGKASEAAEFAQELDARLTKALEENAELRDQIKELENR